MKSAKPQVVGAPPEAAATKKREEGLLASAAPPGKASRSSPGQHVCVSCGGPILVSLEGGTVPVPSSVLLARACAWWQ